MTIEERVDRLEANWGKTDPLVRYLRDAVTVTAELEHRQGKSVLEHSKRIAEHEEWQTRHAAAMERHDAAMKDLDVRIANLVFGVLEWKYPGEEWEPNTRFIAEVKR